MSLFKDLIDELKEENLLEETIDEHHESEVDEFAVLDDDASESDEASYEPGDMVVVDDADEEYGAIAAENFTSVELLDSETLDPYIEAKPETSFNIVDGQAEEAPEMQTKEATKIENEPISAPTSEFESNEDSDIQNDPDPELESQIEPEIKPEIESEIVAESETEPIAESDTQTETVAESDTQAETETVAESDTQAEIETEAEEDTQAETDTEAETETQTETEVADDSDSPVETEVVLPELSKAEYAQRLIDSVKSLQHVQHIISGVYREQMREKPISYDMVTVKQALHKFVEAVENSDDAESASAEAILHEAIGKWHSVLLGQDRKASAAHLRRYCEDTNPPLSDEAVSAMARFYRNSPFNEDVRSKFDLVVTRLFTKLSDDDKREPVLHRDEILASIKKLYAEWSSVSLYNDENEDSDIILAAFKFEDFVSEVNKVQNFDELIKSSFFKRIKNFKEKLQENSFSPLLVAVAVECNVVIGNRYIDLINSERKKVDDKNASRKFRKSRKSRKPQENPTEIISRHEEESNFDRDGITSSGFSKVMLDGKRKWFSAAALASFLLVISLFSFGSFSANEIANGEIPKTEDGAIVNLEKSSFSEFIRSARIKGDLFLGETTEEWDKLPFARKEELLRKIQLAGVDRGYNQVQLSNRKGESVGLGSASGINVIE